MTSQACIGLYKKACTLPSIYIITPASLLHHAPPLRLHHPICHLSAQPGHSTRTISFRLGVSLGAISKIRREHCYDVPVAVGGCPSKLTPATEHHLVRLTTYGGSATAAAAARELATTLGGPIHRTTAAQVLKGLVSMLSHRRRSPLSSVLTSEHAMSMLSAIYTGLWRTGRRSSSQMRLRSTAWGLMGGNGLGRDQGRAFLQG
jgi:hypothetical protein